MYIGVGPETGKRVSDRDAFSYACEICLYGDAQEQMMFMQMSRECNGIEEFADMLVEWFYSGNWIYDASDNKKIGWIIRFSDNSLRSFFGTYADAIKSAREEAAPKGLGFVVN